MSSRPLRRAFRLMYLTGPFPSRTRGSRMPLNSSCTWPLRHLQSHGSGRRFRAGAPRHHGPQRQAPGACQPLRVPHREGHREVLGDELKGRQHAPHRSRIRFSCRALARCAAANWSCLDRSEVTTIP